MDTPLGVPAHIGFVQPHGPHGAASVVHSADRLWDALSMLMIVAGTTLFLLARNGLASLANGTQTLPAGVTSYVQRADYFSAQSSLGLLMIGVGVVVGIAAAIRHAIRRRA